jgi:release factor glutamine methyltransferase
MLTVLDIIRKTTDFFQSKGIETPRLDAELLLSHALGMKRMELYLQFERMLTDAELEKLRPLVRRRGTREPLQHIVGDLEFANIVLKTDRRALIPRPETEELVELVACAVSAPPRRIADLGTGSGAIALALADRFPEATVTAVEISADAAALARENAARVPAGGRVSIVVGDWKSILGEGGFDLIVSNPPYLSADEVAAAAPEVREFEPRGALVADDAGRAALEEIIRMAPGALMEGGLVALETGIDHHEALLCVAEAVGFATCESVQDLSGRDRFLFLRREPRS